MWQRLVNLQGEKGKSNIIVGDFNMLLSVINVFGRHKISKDIVEMNKIISQLDLINIYRLFHPTRAECTFFSRSQGHSKEWTTFCSIKNTMISWRKFKNYIRVLSEHCGIKLEI